MDSEQAIGVQVESSVIQPPVNPEPESIDIDKIFKERRKGIDDAWDRAVNIGDTRGYVWDTETEKTLRQNPEHAATLDELVEIAGARENNTFHEDETYTVKENGQEVKKNAHDVIPGVVSAVEELAKTNPEAQKDFAVLKDSFRTRVVIKGEDVVLTHDEWIKAGYPKGDFRFIVPMEDTKPPVQAEENKQIAPESNPAPEITKEALIQEVRGNLTYYASLLKGHLSGEIPLHPDPEKAKQIAQNLLKMYPELRGDLSKLADEAVLGIRFRDNQRMEAVLKDLDQQRQIAPDEKEQEEKRIAVEQKLFDAENIQADFSQIQREFAQGGLLEKPEQRRLFYESYKQFRDNRPAIEAQLKEQDKKGENFYSFKLPGRDKPLTIEKAKVKGALKVGALAGGILFFIMFSTIMQGEGQAG